VSPAESSNRCADEDRLHIIIIVTDSDALIYAASLVNLRNNRRRSRVLSLRGLQTDRIREHLRARLGLDPVRPGKPSVPKRRKFPMEIRVKKNEKIRAYAAGTVLLRDTDVNRSCRNSVWAFNYDRNPA